RVSGETRVSFRVLVPSLSLGLHPRCGGSIAGSRVIVLGESIGGLRQHLVQNQESSEISDKRLIVRDATAGVRNRGDVAGLVAPRKVAASAQIEWTLD